MAPLLGPAIRNKHLILLDFFISCDDGLTSAVVVFYE
jgi:hypothetical protein